MCMRFNRAPVLLFVLGLAAGAFSLTFTKVAGSFGGPGWDDGNGIAARFNLPSAAAADAAGNIYVADSENHTVRKISPAGEVTTLAGLAETPGIADGKGWNARFSSPSGIAVDGAGNVYVADTGNNTIRKISPRRVVTTLAGLAGTGGWTDGSRSAARFSGPAAMSIDGDGNLYVCDVWNSAIRRITPGGDVSTLAGGTWGSGDGTGTGASFRYPRGIAYDAASAALYVADQSNYVIRKITVPGAVVTTYAGTMGLWGVEDGFPGRFSHPSGVAVGAGGILYVADGNRIRTVAADRSLGVLAGTGTYGSADGAGTDAKFQDLAAVTVSGGTLYAVDRWNDAIRAIDVATATVSTFAGAANESGHVDATGAAARFLAPSAIDYYPGPAPFAYVSEPNSIRKVTASGVVTTLAGDSISGYVNGTGSAARFTNPRGIAIRSADAAAYVADSGNHCIRLVTASGSVSLFAGQPGVCGTANGGRLATAQFCRPVAVALNANDTALYVMDAQSGAVRKIDLGSGTVSTLVGSGAGTISDSGGLNAVTAISVDASENVYLADSANYTVRKVTPAGVVSTVAGHFALPGGEDGVGTAASFGYPGPVGIAGASSGTAYVADEYANLIRSLRLSDATVGTEAGGRKRRGSADGTGPFARFIAPHAVALQPPALVAVVDGHTIRFGKPEIDDRAVIDVQSGDVGVTRHLDTSPQTATSWSWSIVRRPAGSTATLSSTTVRNPVFTPDIDDLYVFRCVATGTGGTSISTVMLAATKPPTASAVVSGGGTICGGADPGAATIAATLAGEAPWSVTWTDGVTQDTQTSPVTRSVSPKATTAYTLTALSDINGPSTVITGSAVVTTRSIQTITAPDSICGAGNATASVPDAGAGATYVWSVTGATVTGATNGPTIFFRAYSSGTVELAVTVTNANGCSSGVKSIPISSVPSTYARFSFPQTGALQWCANTPGYSAYASNIAGVTYDWTIINGTITAGQGTSAVEFSTGAVGPTVIRLIATSASGCARSSTLQFGPQTMDYGPASAGVAVTERVFDRFADGGTVLLTTNCSWTATSSAAWLTVSTPSGSGDAAVGFTVSANTKSIARTATLTVAGIEIPITQSGTGGYDGQGLSVERLAGRDLNSGYADGRGTGARFSLPLGMVADSVGNVFIADNKNHVIRKMDSSGNVTTFAGRAGSPGYIDATGTEARLNYPSYIAIDGSGNLYVTEGVGASGLPNYTIRKITPAGVVTTLAGKAGAAGTEDGHGTAARFENPAGITMAPDGNLYVADSYNCTIRRVTPSGDVTTFTGVVGAWWAQDGAVGEATFDQPNGITADPAGNLYVVEPAVAAVRKIDPSGNVSTLAGSIYTSGYAEGNGDAARFAGWLWDIAYSGGSLYVGDGNNGRVRKISLTGDVTTLAGGNSTIVDGNGGAAGFVANFAGIAADNSGKLFISDGGRIRTIDGAANVVTRAGVPLLDPALPRDGNATAAVLSAGPLAVDASGNVYVGERTCIRKITPAGDVSTFAGNCSVSSLTDGPLATAAFRSIWDVALDLSGNLYVADYYTIRRISGGTVTTVAGLAGMSRYADGTGANAMFRTASGLACDAAGNVYIADGTTIRKMTASGVVTTIAGRADISGYANGNGQNALFSSAIGVAIGTDGALRVIDASTYRSATTNACIRKVTLAGDVTTVAGSPGLYGTSDGNGANARFMPSRIASDGAGAFFITDTSQGTVRKLLADNSVITVAGLPESIGASTGSGSSVRMTPQGIALGPGGRLYISEGLVAVASTNSVAPPTGLNARATAAAEVTVSWSAVSGVTSYEIWRRGAPGAFAKVGTTTATSWVDGGVVAAHAYLYAVRAVAAGGGTSPLSAPDLATTVLFSDDPASAGTPIRATHIMQLRAAADAVRSLAGVSGGGYTDTTVSAGTPVRRLHLAELRAAVDSGRSALGLTDWSWTDATLGAGSAAKAIHVQEMRNALK